MIRRSAYLFCHRHLIILHVFMFVLCTSISNFFLWVNEPQYQTTINDPVPVLLTFSRSFVDRSDIFLANHQLTDITANGTVVFLNHLQFDTPLYIVDASMVAFSGKVYFYNTAYGAIEGCPVTPATVCAFQTQIFS